MKKSIAASFTAIILAFSLVFSGVPLAFGADGGVSTRTGELGSGTIPGSSIEWILSSDGTLSLTGSGAMPNDMLYAHPWESDIAQVKKVVVGNGITTIGNYAFSQHTNLISASLPSSITIIGRNAFSSCPKLTHVSMQEGITSIKSQAFSYCEDLGISSLPDSIITIEDESFRNCSSLKISRLPSHVSTLGIRAFTACSSIQSLTIPASVTSIDKEAFADCGNTDSDSTESENPIFELTFEGTTAPNLTGDIIAGNTNIAIHIPVGATGYASRYWPVNQILWPISLAEATGGTAQASMTAAKPGQTVKLTAQPDRGFRLSGWDVNPNTVSVIDNKFTMPIGELTITPQFEDISYLRFAVTVNDSSAATSGAGKYVAGDTVSLDAGTREGFTFKGWASADGVEFADASAAQTTFTMPDHAVTVSATWEAVGGPGEGNQSGTDPNTPDEDGDDPQTDNGGKEPARENLDMRDGKGGFLPATGDDPLLTCLFMSILLGAAWIATKRYERERLAAEKQGSTTSGQGRAAPQPKFVWWWKR